MNFASISSLATMEFLFPYQPLSRSHTFTMSLQFWAQASDLLQKVIVDDTHLVYTPHRELSPCLIKTDCQVITQVVRHEASELCRNTSPWTRDHCDTRRIVSAVCASLLVPHTDTCVQRAKGRCRLLRHSLRFSSATLKLQNIDGNATQKTSQI